MSDKLNSKLDRILDRLRLRNKTGRLWAIFALLTLLAAVLIGTGLLPFNLFNFAC